VRRPASIAAVLLAIGLGACGFSGDDRVEPRTPDTEDGEVPVRAPTDGEVAVIRGWSDALRAGHVSKAASYFAVPVRVADGTNPLRDLLNRDAVEDFNRGLPCGARLEETERGPNSLVIATFRLTERPGRGSCGPGTGSRAWTAFLIRDRHIVQWLRVADPAQAEPPAGDVS
jgi:hypothetical protein